MNLIVVDDERHAIKMMQKHLAELVPDATIHCFERAKDALEFATSHPTDVAFLDINMPVMDGVTLAKELKKINTHINVIFCTGYSEHMAAAINMHASGYLLKPSGKADVKKALDNLLYPVETPKARFYAKTFGAFEFFVDGTPVKFSRSKSKELLAYLISLRGSGTNRKEISAILFEDRYDTQTQNYLTKIYKDLCVSLESAGGQGIVKKHYNSYWVDTSMFSCDYYDYIDGDPRAINAFQGEFMSQYDWAYL